MIEEDYTHTQWDSGIEYITRRVFLERERSSHPDFLTHKEKGLPLRNLPYLLKKQIGHWPMAEVTHYDCSRYDRYSCWEVGSQRMAYSMYGTGFPAIGLPSLDINTNINDKLLGKIHSLSLNVAMVWFERKDTFRTIQSRALQLLAAARQIRKGKFSRAAKTLGIKLSQRSRKRLKRNRLDQFSENWLEYRYGWTPLLLDIYNASDLIAHGLNKGDGNIHVHTSSQDEVSSSLSGVKPREKRYEYWYMDGSYTARARYSAGVTFQVHDIEDLWASALGLDNPLLVAWELVPFSFIVDWFLPVGDKLQALTAFRGLKFVDGYTSTLVKKHMLLTGYTRRSYYGNRWHKDVIGFEPASSIEDVTFQRQVLSSFDDLTTDPFETDNGVNAVRALDAVTLLHGFLKSLK